MACIDTRSNSSFFTYMFDTITRFTHYTQYIHTIYQAVYQGNTWICLGSFSRSKNTNTMFLRSKKGVRYVLGTHHGNIQWHINTVCLRRGLPEFNNWCCCWNRIHWDSCCCWVIRKAALWTRILCINSITHRLKHTENRWHTVNYWAAY